LNLQIEDYFSRVRRTIEACPFIRSCRVTYDKRITHTGLVRGELSFVDGSVLYLREFVDVETAVDRLMYAYQYMDWEMRLVFRYDNSGHHKRLRLSSFPHHKHIGSERVVATAPVPTLPEILSEIERKLVLP
jgi:hypothetical protein